MADATSTLVTLLTDGWTSGNTDDITPTIARIQEHKQLDLNNKDYVFLYEQNQEIAFFGLGATTFQQVTFVTIDMRTTFKNQTMANVRTHAIKVKEEIERILKANVDQPDANFLLLVPVRSRDLSDKTVGIGRFIFDVALKKWGA